MAQPAKTAVQGDRTTFPVVMILTGTTIIATTDLATKWISSELSIWQLLFMRSAFGLLLLLPLLLVVNRLRLIGFVGVLLILRLESASFDWFATLPVLAGFFYASTQIYTRKYCKSEHSLALSFWLTAVFMMVGLSGMAGLYFLPQATQPGFLSYPRLITDQAVTVTLIAVAIGSLAMHFSLAAAYQNAPASLIAPLEYLYMPLAIMGGLIFFDETPHPAAILGIAIIIGAGLIITWRERIPS